VSLCGFPIDADVETDPSFHFHWDQDPSVHFGEDPELVS
jgi:hypothetical protein